MIRCIWLIAALFSCANVFAHEVHSDVSDARVKVVTLRYADGEPFSYEEYEVRADGVNVPLQRGRTDAQGRVAILPVPGKKLAFKAVSEDGHGVTMQLDTEGNTDAVMPTRDIPRKLLILAGSGFVFGLFGLWQLFFRRGK